MLTNTDILDLYDSIARKEPRGNPKHKVIWRDTSGEITVTYSKPKQPSTTVGSFTGKAGTMSRSRKGRTYRNPDGSRKYIGPANYDGNPEVIAYRLNPS